MKTILPRRTTPMTQIPTKKITLMAILAALYAVGTYLPGLPMLGAPGSEIDLVRGLEIGYGLVLGPIYGPITAFIGAFIGKLLTGSGFGLFFTPLAPVTAFVGAMLGRKQDKSWMIGAGVLIALIIGWYLNPLGRTAWLYPTLHLSGLFVILLFRGKLAEYVNSDDRKNITIGVLLCSFPATLAGHLLGGLIFIFVAPTTPEFFMAILPISTIERILISIIATIIGTPLILAVRQTYPGLLED